MADDSNETRPITLSELRPVPGSRRPRKRIGRGPGSGTGKTSGKGHKGTKARAGGSTNPGFEGGQMPMYRRLPKRGFTNPFKVIRQPVNLEQLAKVVGTEITGETLAAAGVLKNADDPIKVLGQGDISRAVTLRGVPVSAAARAKIEAAGGQVLDG